MQNAPTISRSPGRFVFKLDALVETGCKRAQTRGTYEGVFHGKPHIEADVRRLRLQLYSAA
jgi:hypothetical protein